MTEDPILVGADTKKLSRYIIFLNRAVAVLGALSAFATLPQILEIWVNKDASGVSEWTWGYYCLYSAVLLLYGIAHKQKPIVIAYSAGLISYIVVFIGALVY